MNTNIYKPVTFPVTAHTVVGVDQTAGRYEVTLTYVPETKSFIIAVPNHYKSLETEYPTNCAYKLAEKGMMKGDAKAVEAIVANILLPQMRLALNKMRQI